MIPTRIQARVLAKLQQGWKLTFKHAESEVWGELRPPQGHEGSPIPVTRLTARKMEVKGLIQFDGFKGDDIYYGLPRV